MGGTAERAHLALWGHGSCRRVHDATLTVLEECGVEVRNHPRSLELFAAAGAQVDGPRVRFAPELVERALASAPKTWLVPWRPLPGGGARSTGDDAVVAARDAAGGAGSA
ncbi:MAG TPA: trimethylamine methyltransferase family protein, partial [Thermoleophilia bacterium]|nr:trimethylamine methyltransferase family protein [Thermoleophilia bacterium]